MRSFDRVLVLALALAGLGSEARAQDLEPNDLCTPVAEGRATNIPAVLQGALEPRDAAGPNDVDHIPLSTAPGALRLTGGGDRLVGIFDAQCRLLERSGPSGQLDFRVPASGTLILAVAQAGDEDFDGSGRADRTGPYQLTLTRQPPSIGALSGRVIDAVSGTPISGAERRFPRAELRRCRPSGGCDLLARQDLDMAGRFRFEVDTDKLRIAPGALRVTALAGSYESRDTDLSVAADQVLDVGDIALEPPALQVSDVRPCGSVGTGGDRCAFTVTLQNGTATRLSGSARSLVEVTNGQFARFEVGTTLSDGLDVTRSYLTIPARSSRSVRYVFDLPADLDNGTTLCARMLFGLNPSPLANTALDEELFCVAKGASSFRVMSPAESRAQRERLAE